MASSKDLQTSVLQFSNKSRISNSSREAYEEICLLVSENLIDEAFNELLKIKGEDKKSNGLDIITELVLLRAQYKDIEDDNANNVIEKDYYYMKKSTVRKSLLS
ncbi:MAG: hypothetical protein AAGC85_21700, partial [Bacteroidota bacterium]